MVTGTNLRKKIWSVEDPCLDKMREIKDQEQSCWLWHKREAAVAGGALGWYSGLTAAGARPGLPGQKACSASVCQLKEELLSREGQVLRRAEILFF